MFKRIGEQPLGMVLGFVMASALFVMAFGIALVGGRVLASHDDPSVIHACLNQFTGQVRVVPEGVAPNCNDNELLVDFASGGVVVDVGDLEARVGDLEAENDALAQRVGDLEDENAALTQRVENLESENTALRSDLNELDEQIPDCLVDENGDAVFEGCNVHVRNGEGETDTTNGAGNLIVGYNENVEDFERSGSHNLVVGLHHGYSSYGGFVAGIQNIISGRNASVSGGELNEASGPASSVSGGSANTASGINASVSGGLGNQADDVGSSVSGGGLNIAEGVGASISGGQENVASGIAASVSGGQSNAASAFASSVSGGSGRTASGDHDWVAGSLSEDF